MHDAQNGFNRETGGVAVEVLLSLREKYGFLLLAYVFMPDHAHFVIVPAGEFTIAQTMRVVKGSIARRLNALRGSDGRFWQEGFWDEVPRTPAQLNAYIDYVHDNPVKAGLSSTRESFAFSSGGGSCLADYQQFLSADREQP